VRLATTTAFRRRLLSGSVVVVVAAAAALATGGGIAAADSGWSRSPGSGIGGGTVDVASSPSTLCQWIQPAGLGDPPPTSGDPTTTSTSPAPAATATPSGDTVYDGTEVRVRLVQDKVEVPVAAFAVTPGGAWSGTVTLPGTGTLPPGTYDLFVKCVIDRPELDGVRTYDFDPLSFTVAEAPPPTTVEPPVELVPPITAVNPVQVQGVQVTRPASTPAAKPVAAAATATLPNTGDGTLETALAGLAALTVGGAALWWGARHGRDRAEADLLDG